MKPKDMSKYENAHVQHVANGDMIVTVIIPKGCYHSVLNSSMVAKDGSRIEFGPQDHRKPMLIVNAKIKGFPLEGESA